jgi:hypothetical protein
MGDLYTKPMAKASSLRRGLSPTIWSQAPLTEISNGGLTEGFGFIDDFLAFDDATARWLLTNATSGTAIVDPAAIGGALLLNAGATTLNQGVQIQMGGEVASASFIASATSKIYYEARVKISTIGSTTGQIFVGLSEVLATLFASAANTSTNHIGYEIFNTTAMGLHSEKGGVRDSSAAAHTVVDGTYVKLGFVVDGLTKITPYVNGVAKTAITLVTAIPIVEMTPSFVCKAGATTRPVLSIDWVACYQVEQIAN